MRVRVGVSVRGMRWGGCEGMNYPSVGHFAMLSLGR